MKTDLVLFLLLLVVSSQDAKTFGCANQKMVKMIGEDPLSFQVKERFIEFPEGVQFSHKVIAETMSSLLKGKDYFGKKSTHYSAIVNGIFVFVVETPQVTLFQALMKTSLKRTTAQQTLLPGLVYLKTEVEAKEKYAIHQITLGKLKRELFNEETQTVNSFTGVQFQNRIINIVFATYDVSFTADEDFLKSVGSIIGDIEKGKKCEEFICDPPSLNSVAEATQDLAVIKFECTKNNCSYSSKGKKREILTKIPFLQAGKTFRYLDKPRNGLLITVVEVQQPTTSVSITAQLNLKCNIKDLDYHKEGYSAAILSVNLGEYKLYSVLIIEPGENGIKRSIRTQTPEMYDQLDGIDKVKMIYYFMIISSKGPDAIFEDFFNAIQQAKLNDAKKYTCTLPKPVAGASFLQVQAYFEKDNIVSNQRRTRRNQEYSDYDDLTQDQDNYIYMYDYDYDQNEEEYDDKDQEYDNYDESYDGEEGYDKDQEYGDENLYSDDSETQQTEQQATPPTTSYIQAEKQEMCFEAFSECNFQGSSLMICGPNPSVPKELQDFYIRSMKIPEQMKITFFTNQKKKIQLQGNQVCLKRPFEVGNLTPRKQNEFLQLSHQ